MASFASAAPNYKAASKTVSERALGRSYANLYHHMGSKDHFTHFRCVVHGLPYDEAAWIKYTLGNNHGPQRSQVKQSGEVTKQVAKRKGIREIHGAAHLSATKRAAGASTPLPSPLPVPHPSHPRRTCHLLHHSLA